jgi:predicted AAA+ superfamily ATPase
MDRDLIQRTKYIEKLEAWRGKQVIKVVTGVRRCGKSTLLTMYKDKLIENGVQEANIIYINLEEMANNSLLTAEALHNFVSERLAKKETTYVFIDEIQKCPGFEKAVDSLHIKKNVDLYITGSNATMLSGDLATLLSGRYVEIDMLPLSFAEYLLFAEKEYPIFKAKEGLDYPYDYPYDYAGSAYMHGAEELFNNYIRFGSLPYIPELPPDMQIVEKYLDGVYNTIVVKDIVTREGIKEVAILEDVVRFLCSSIGSPISIKKISDAIKSAGRRISVNTVDQYVRALVTSFIFYKVDRYDVKGKQHLKTQSKYYIVDTGIRNLLLAQSSPDFGHVLENIVYFELIRRGNKVSIGKIGDSEVDFVATNTIDGTNYYQVAATVIDEDTLKRELAPLQKIQDHFSKYLLTFDVIGKGTYHNGIKQLNVLDWLLG